jgi:outer membrane protein TolC
MRVTASSNRSRKNSRCANGPIVLAEKSYDAGRTSKFEVLAETVKALNSAMLLADARFNQLSARSQYYKALGGGF